MNKKKAITSLVVTLFFIIEEIIFKILINNLTIDYSILRIILYSAILGILITNIAYIAKTKKWQNTILIILCLVSSIYSLAQLGFTAYFGIYMSVNTGGQLGAVKSYILDFIKSLKPVYYTILLPIIPLIVYCILRKNKKEETTNKNIYKEVYISLLLLVTLGIMYYETINLKFMQNKYQTITNKELFKYPSNPSTTVNQFGINGYFLLDIKSLFQNKVEISYGIK